MVRFDTFLIYFNKFNLKSTNYLVRLYIYIKSIRFYQEKSSNQFGISRFLKFIDTPVFKLRMWILLFSSITIYNFLNSNITGLIKNKFILLRSLPKSLWIYFRKLHIVSSSTCACTSNLLTCKCLKYQNRCNLGMILIATVK